MTNPPPPPPVALPGPRRRPRLAEMRSTSCLSLLCAPHAHAPRQVHTSPRSSTQHAARSTQHAARST
eukprot:2905309-Rhodomonas_salina.2